MEEKITLYVPDVAILELVNALFYRVFFDRDRLSEVVKTFYRLELEIIPISEILVASAIERMLKNKIASYDAFFIALAEQEKCPLITADRKHHRKEISKRIRYL